MMLPRGATTCLYPAQNPWQAAGRRRSQHRRRGGRQTRHGGWWL